MYEYDYDVNPVAEVVSTNYRYRVFHFQVRSPANSLNVIPRLSLRIRR